MCWRPRSRIGRVGEGLLKSDELRQIVIVERVGLAEVAAGVELVVPDLARWRAFLEEEDHSLDARPLEGSAGAVEHGVEVAAFQQQLARLTEALSVFERKVF